jgi:serine/threonine-protein kinase
MLTTDKHGATRAVVMDFGLALPVGHPDQELSTPGAGTPEYMPPEQAAGDELTQAADIYAFAVVACELLTGKRPRDGGLDLLPGRMRSAVRQCLDANPSVRPTSCASFLARLFPSLARRLWLFAGVAAAAAAIIWFVPRNLATPADPSVAVLPFEGAGVSEEALALRESLADGVSAHLARTPRLRVIPSESASRFSRPHDRLEDFARKINARYVITGRMMLEGGRVHVSVQLVDPAEGRTMWGTSFDRRVADLPEIERSIAVMSLAQLGFSTSSMPRTAERNAAADHAYRLGRHHLNNRDPASLQRARQYLLTSIQADGGWAPPYVGLAQTLLATAELQSEPPASALPAARDAIDRALSLDPRSAEAYAARGLLASVYHHNFAAAERDLLTAIDLDPNNVIAHQWYSYTLIKERRTGKARDESDLALRLDPLSVPAHVNRAAILLYSRDYSGLLELMDRLSELSPINELPPVLRAYSFARLGRTSDARRELEAVRKVVNPTPTLLRLTGETLMLLGEREEALRIAAQLERMRDAGTGVSSSYIAFLYAAAGEREEAFRWMEIAWQEGDTFLSLLHVYPACDGLRSDPRYASLVSRLGIRGNKEQG